MPEFGCHTSRKAMPASTPTAGELPAAVLATVQVAAVALHEGCRVHPGHQPLQARLCRQRPCGRRLQCTTQLQTYPIPSYTQSIKKMASPMDVPISTTACSPLLSSEHRVRMTASSSVTKRELRAICIALMYESEARLTSYLCRWQVQDSLALVNQLVHGFIQVVLPGLRCCWLLGDVATVIALSIHLCLVPYLHPL